MRKTAVLKGVYVHSPSWNVDNQLIVSAQKVPLSTGIVYHAYSEDNIRKLRSLLQRILACIRMVSFSPYKWIIWVFSSTLIFARANVHGFNRKNFYQNVFHIFFVLHSTWTLCSKIRFVRFIKKRVLIIRSINRWCSIVLIPKVKGPQSLPLWAGRTLSRNALCSSDSYPQLRKLYFFHFQTSWFTVLICKKGLLFLLSFTFDSFHSQGSNSLRPVTIVLQSRHPDNISSRVLWRLWSVVTFWRGYWRCWDAYYCCGHVRLFTV